jgi:hypothetical protein
MDYVINRPRLVSSSLLSSAKPVAQERYFLSQTPTNANFLEAFDTALALCDTISIEKNATNKTFQP